MEIAVFYVIAFVTLGKAFFYIGECIHRYPKIKTLMPIASSSPMPIALCFC